MKAIEINGTIKVYSKLPNSWKGVMGNFSKLSDEEIKAYGFYDVVTPDYNSTIKKLSDIFWDADNEVFTYNVSDIEFSQTISELKEAKINELKNRINFELVKTDWYITRKVERNIDIPSNIVAQRNDLFSKCETKEVEINALTTKANIITYEFE
tara:strand:+ start:57 stop:518 length:462 start_codon:yes stop_codon:yes gene_type:complete